MRKFSMKTISTNLLDNIKGVSNKIRIFNFQNGVNTFSLAENDKQKSIIGSYNTAWIRVFDENNNYYDFVTSGLFFVANKNGLVLLLDEDTQYVTAKFIAEKILYFVNENMEQKLTSEKYINEYYNKITKEINKAVKRLEELYSSSSQISNSRFNIEDSFEYGKLLLNKQYLVDLVAKNIIRENMQYIMEVID